MSQFAICFAFLLLSPYLHAEGVPTSPRAENAITKVEPGLTRALSEKELRYGAPIFVRIFKDPGILEVWLESASGKYQHFKTYDICYFSGRLGPKLKQGDSQSPEGFYFVNANRLNPWSRFHLSFNIGYPNEYDRYHGRTGSALMVHGNCVSIGCYAMTDAYINEIYALAAKALASGQAFFRVHIFPFPMTDNTLKEYQSTPWHSFWLNLQQGYEYFEAHRKPPNVEVVHGRYTFGTG